MVQYVQSEEELALVADVMPPIIEVVRGKGEFYHVCEGAWPSTG